MFHFSLFSIIFTYSILLLFCSLHYSHEEPIKDIDIVSSFNHEDLDQSYDVKRTPKSSKKQSTSNRAKLNGTNISRKTKIKRVVHPSLYAAWDEYNNLCILAKFQAVLTIKYETSSGIAQLIDKMPVNAIGKGSCDQFSEEPVLDVMWRGTQLHGAEKPNSTAGFTFRIKFNKFPEEKMWGVEQMLLYYHTGHPVFRGAINPKKFIVKSDKEDHRLQFRTSLTFSMLCPSPPPIQMYDNEGTVKAIVRLSNMQLEAFEFSDPREGNNFDQFMRCEQVSFGSGVAHPLTNIRNDSLAFAIGIMTVCIATLTVVGYAVYRSHVVKAEKYSNIN